MVEHYWSVVHGAGADHETTLIELDPPADPDSGSARPRVAAWAGLVAFGLVAVLVVVLAAVPLRPSVSEATATPQREAMPTAIPLRVDIAYSPRPTTSLPPLVSVRGVVRDDRDQPLPAARVSMDPCSAALGSVMTGTDGGYTAAFRPGPCGSTRVTITADGYEPHQEVIALSESSSHDFVLHPLARIVAGEALSLVLAPGDQKCDEWPMDSNEWPCRKLHVTANATGTLSVQVRWDDPVHQLGLQVYRRWPPREAPPCCDAPTVSVPVEPGDDVEVEVLFLNLGFRPLGGPAHGPQRFTLLTSLSTR